MAWLIEQDDAGKGLRFFLDCKSVSVIGRHADKCNCVIDDERVSRVHAKIWYKGSGFLIEDQASRNRTFVDGKCIQKKGAVSLQDGSVISICDHYFAFHLEDPDVVEEESTSFVEWAVQPSTREILETQSAEKLALLLEITTDLTQTIDGNELLPRIADKLLGIFRQAERLLLFTDEKEINERRPRIFRPRKTEDRSSARFSQSIVRNCLNSGKAFLCRDLTKELPDNVPPESVYQSQIRSILCAPMKGRNEQIHGVIQLDTQDGTQRFTQEDLNFLIAVSSQASLALENAVQAGLERDLQTARQIQRGFLPRRYPDIPGYPFETAFETAQAVGGDYYDFVTLPDGRIAVLLGDATGKGIPAALLMARFSSMAQTALLTEPTLARAMTKLNAQTCEMINSDKYVTLVAMLLDQKEHTVTYVNAGHPLPLLYSRTRNTLKPAFTSEESGFFIGTFDDTVYEEFTLALEPGDCLLIYSDGVLDSCSQQDKCFGTEGIYRALTGNAWTPSLMVESLKNAVELHSRGCPQADDFTIVSFGRMES